MSPSTTTVILPRAGAASQAARHDVARLIGMIFVDGDGENRGGAAGVEQVDRRPREIQGLPPDA